MSRKKRLQKKKMKQDQLVTTALKSSQWIQEHFTKVVVGLAILVAGVAIVLFTANARRNTAIKADDELALGITQFRNRDIQLAATTFLNLSDRYSGHRAGVTAMYFLGESYLEQNRYDEAMTAYDRYLQSSDDDAYFAPAAMIGLAVALEGQQKFVDAARTLEQVLQTLPADDPRYMDVTFRSALFYQRANSLDDARKLFTLVAESNDGRLKPQADLWLAILE